MLEDRKAVPHASSMTGPPSTQPSQDWLLALDERIDAKIQNADRKLLEETKEIAKQSQAAWLTKQSETGFALLDPVTIMLSSRTKVFASVDSRARTCHAFPPVYPEDMAGQSAMNLSNPAP